MDRFDDWFDTERGAVAPTDARAPFCRKAAEQLLRRAGVNAPPVPVVAIAEMLGFAVERKVLTRGLDARAVLAQDMKVIELDAQASNARQRFSVAHELGHFCLGHVHEDGQMAERQANVFAGALLVPAKWLRRDVKTLTTIAALAQRYEVSRDVMTIAVSDAKLLGLVR